MSKALWRRQRCITTWSLSCVCWAGSSDGAHDSLSATGGCFGGGGGGGPASIHRIFILKVLICNNRGRKVNGINLDKMLINMLQNLNVAHTIALQSIKTDSWFRDTAFTQQVTHFPGRYRTHGEMHHHCRKWVDSALNDLCLGSGCVCFYAFTHYLSTCLAALHEYMSPCHLSNVTTDMRISLEQALGAAMPQQESTNNVEE